MSEYDFLRVCDACKHPCRNGVCEHCGGLGVFYPPLLTDWEIRFLNGEFFDNIDTTVHCP